MRTLRKALSLLLCLAMLLSLGIFSVSAADAVTTDNVDAFNDHKDVGEAYEEAIDVMIGVGIINGMSAEEPRLEPLENYTRAQAAKIITYMKLGPTPAEKLPIPTSDPYDDVLASMWAAKYIAYCTAEGVLVGYGDGNFGPNDTLTGYQWAAMLLRAVGYDSNTDKEEYTGDEWAIHVAKDAIPLGLFAGDINGCNNEPINRQQAILYAFNTFTNISIVSYSSLAGTYVHDNRNELGTWGSYGIGSTTLTGTTLSMSVYKLRPFEGDLLYGAVDNRGEHFYVASRDGTGSLIEFIDNSTSASINKYKWDWTYGERIIVDGVDIESAGLEGRVWAIQNDDGKWETKSGFHRTDHILYAEADGTSLNNLTSRANSAFVAELADTVWVYYDNIVPEYNYVSNNPSATGASYDKIFTDTNSNGKTLAEEGFDKGTKVTLIDSYPYDDLIDKIIVQTENSYLITANTNVTGDEVTVPGARYIKFDQSGNVVSTDGRVPTSNVSNSWFVSLPITSIKNRDLVFAEGVALPATGDVVNVRTRIDGRVYVDIAEAVEDTLTNVITTVASTQFKVGEALLELGKDLINPQGDYIRASEVNETYINDKGIYYKGTEGYVVAYKGPQHIYDLAWVLGTQQVREYGNTSYTARLLFPDNHIDTITIRSINGTVINGKDTLATHAPLSLIDSYVPQGTVSDNDNTHDLRSASGRAIVHFTRNGSMYDLTVMANSDGTGVGAAPQVTQLYYNAGSTTLTNPNGTATDLVVDARTILFVGNTAYVGANIPSFKADRDKLIVYYDVIGGQKLVYAMRLDGNISTPTPVLYTGVVTRVDKSKATQDVYMIDVFEGATGQTTTYRVDSAYGAVALNHDIIRFAKLPDESISATKVYALQNITPERDDLYYLNDDNGIHKQDNAVAVYITPERVTTGGIQRTTDVHGVDNAFLGRAYTVYNSAGNISEIYYTQYTIDDTIADINARLRTGDVYVIASGNLQSNTTQIVIPANRALSIAGSYTAGTAGVSLSDGSTLNITGNFNFRNVSSVSSSTIYVKGNAVATGADTTLNGNVTVDGDLDYTSIDGTIGTVNSSNAVLETATVKVGGTLTIGTGCTLLINPSSTVTSKDGDINGVLVNNGTYEVTSSNTLKMSQTTGKLNIAGTGTLKTASLTDSSNVSFFDYVRQNTVQLTAAVSMVGDMVIHNIKNLIIDQGFVLNGTLTIDGTDADASDPDAKMTVSINSPLRVTKDLVITNANVDADSSVTVGEDFTLTDSTLDTADGSLNLTTGKTVTIQNSTITAFGSTYTIGNDTNVTYTVSSDAQGLNVSSSN